MYIHIHELEYIRVHILVADVYSHSTKHMHVYMYSLYGIT